ncbi:MAG: hypothetical protein ACPHRO_07285, partial [Nannocystaceae bacterium]
MRALPVAGLAIAMALSACRRGGEDSPAARGAAGQGDNAAACPSWAEISPTARTPLPEGTHVAAFEAAWELVRQRHPDPTLGCLPWLELRQRYGARIVKASSVTEAYGIINELLATLKESHLYAWAPNREAPVLEGDGPVGESLGRFVIIDGIPRAVGAAARAGDYAGYVVEAIEGVPWGALPIPTRSASPSTRREARVRSALEEGTRCRVGQGKSWTVRAPSDADGAGEARVVEVP